jgi:hypothetical protein
MTDENNTLADEQQTTQEDPIAGILSDPKMKAALLESLRSEIGPDNEVVKGNLNKAYAEREEMAKELATLRSTQRAAELKQLEESGKQKEADAMRLEEMAQKLKKYEEQFTTLTRDQALVQAMAKMEFKNEKAAQVAQSDMVSALVQDSQGNWVSPTNQSIEDYVQSYASDETNSFLFKAKISSGSSSMTAPSTTSGSVKSDKPVGQMTDEELIEHFNQS